MLEEYRSVGVHECLFTNPAETWGTFLSSVARCLVKCVTVGSMVEAWRLCCAKGLLWGVTT